MYENQKPLESWLGVAIGNSRIHWAYFEENILVKIWHCQHLTHNNISEILLHNLASIRKQKTNNLPVYLASVVPSQTKIWKNYPLLTQIDLQHIPLKALYPTMGIDRALATYGGGEQYGYPCLVIDGGTALTFTGIDEDRTLVGGAILPGLRSQFLALNNQTAALPEIELSPNLPPIWGTNTADAIRSGILYTAIAGISSFINDWLDMFPHSKILLTGGDSNNLYHYLQSKNPELTQKIILDDSLIFYGIQLVAYLHHHKNISSN